MCLQYDWTRSHLYACSGQAPLPVFRSWCGFQLLRAELWSGSKLGEPSLMQLKINNSWAVIQPGKPWKCGFRVNSNRIQHRARLKGTPSRGEVSIPSSGCCKYVQLCAHTCLESFPTNRNPPTPHVLGIFLNPLEHDFFFHSVFSSM